MGTQQLSKLASASNSLVNKERVTCENCRCHYSYLYDAKKAPPEETRVEFSSASAKLRYEKRLRRALYKSTADVWNACPNCGYHQSWMVSLRKENRLKAYGLVTGGVGLVAALAVMVLGAVPHGVNAALFGILSVSEMGWILIAGIAASAALYLPYLFLMWDPNRRVDRQSYEAMPITPIDPHARDRVASQYEFLARKGQIVRASNAGAQPRAAAAGWFSRLVFGGLFVLGLVSFLAPTLSPSLIYMLSERGLLAAPFYLGAAMMAISLLGTSWELFIHTRTRRFSS